MHFFAGISGGDLRPFRCVGLDDSHVSVDFNHPLAGKELRLSCIIEAVGREPGRRVESGGNWMETLIAGPGMQARWQNQPTDFFTDDAFARFDDRPDEKFYQFLEDDGVGSLKVSFFRLVVRAG